MDNSRTIFNLKSIALTCALLTLDAVAYAQCRQTWESDSAGENIEYALINGRDTNGIVLIKDFRIRKVWLDSVCQVIIKSPEKTGLPGNRATDSQQERYEKEFGKFLKEGFKLYRYNGKEIAHYSNYNIPANGEIIEIHEFGFSEGNEWNEDAVYNILYNPVYGVVSISYFNMEMPHSGNWLKNDSCLSDRQNTFLRSLQAWVKDFEDRRFDWNRGVYKH